MKNFFPVAILSFLFLSSCASDIGGWFHNSDDRTRIVRTARQFLGVPYKNGGTTPDGFDCSGFVMYVYEKNGVLLPRSVKSQYGVGKKIRRGEMKTGDLVFYNTLRKRFSHVGIYVGENRFIHAPRTGKQVSYADMDKPYWKKRFAGAVTFMRGNRL